MRVLSQMNDGQAWGLSVHSPIRGTRTDPALSRERARWKSVLLDQQPSLLTLRRRCSVFVRMIPRYYAAVRLLADVHASRAALAFARRPPAWLSRRCLRGLPVLVLEVSRRAVGSSTTPDRAGTRAIAPPHVACRHYKSVGVRVASFVGSRSGAMPLRSRLPGAPRFLC